jgi:CBS domain-containing protein
MTRHKEIHARDIMEKQVVKLDPGMPVKRAIETLEENEISGAPVVDSSSRLVGILTKSDLTRSEHVHSGRLEPTRGEWPSNVPSEDGDVEGDEILSMESYSPEVGGEDTVSEWMHAGVVTVPPWATLQQVCRVMLKHRIHRVVVADGKDVQGILTSFDVVRCIAEKG